MQPLLELFVRRAPELPHEEAGEASDAEAGMHPSSAGGEARLLTHKDARALVLPAMFLAPALRVADGLAQEN